MRTANPDQDQLTHALIAILVLGSLWGFSEVVVSAAIGAAGLPYRAAILTGIGMGLMAIAFAVFRKPLMPVGLAIVAILCKQLVVPILHLPLMCKANSCLAVLLQGLGAAGTTAILKRRLESNAFARISAGPIAAVLSAVAFYSAGMRLAPCQYLLAFQGGPGFVAFLAAEAVPWAVTSAVTFPMGYALGKPLRDRLVVLRSLHPALYYGANAAVVATSWIASALTIAAGF